ncbi:MAG: hypothetical protein GVY14_10715 [Spirochaetes bacterium]|jgi:hypothetical protein|nr:hypothetical protein [Spirochaetota bacterium]
MWADRSQQIALRKVAIYAFVTRPVPTPASSTAVSFQSAISSNAATYGRYRHERIQRLGQRFSTCGDYLQGVARIRCTKPECGHDYFRPFSCKSFYLCPSCSRKRTILFAEVSRLIYRIIDEFFL